MPYYQLALHLVFFLLVFILVGKRLERWCRPFPRQKNAAEAGKAHGAAPPARPSLFERLRERALPNLPMI